MPKIHGFFYHGFGRAIRLDCPYMWMFIYWKLTIIIKTNHTGNIPYLHICKWILVEYEQCLSSSTFSGCFQRVFFFCFLLLRCTWPRVVKALFWEFFFGAKTWAKHPNINDLKNLKQHDFLNYQSWIYIVWLIHAIDITSLLNQCLQTCLVCWLILPLCCHQDCFGPLVPVIYLISSYVIEVLYGGSHGKLNVIWVRTRCEVVVS